MNDLRFAFRQLLKSPGFTVVVVLTLALGIGANTAIFSVINAVLLRPPPYEDPERLVFLSETSQSSGDLSIAYPNFLDWQSQQEGFSSLAAFREDGWNLTGSGQPERVNGLQVTANFFSTLGVPPLCGRVFTAEEDKVGGEKVAVMSEGLWRRRFGSNPAALNQPITLNGESFVVVGVMPASFQFPRKIELWTPLGPQASWMNHRWLRPGIYAIGRLNPGVDMAAARTRLEVVAARLAKDFPNSNSGHGVKLMPLHERVAGPNLRSALNLLWGAVLLVLLIACANVTNLLLARASQRRKEMAVRLAIGAGRWRLFRHLMTESLLLAALGGLAGLLSAYWSLDLLRGLLPAEINEVIVLGIDQTVLYFSLVVAMAAGILFGFAPAWRLSSHNLNEALKEGGRPETGGMGRSWGQGGLIVGEVALASMLLVGAGLLLRSFSRLQAVPMGLDPHHVLTLEISLPHYKYSETRRQSAFHQQTLEAVRLLPGVISAGFVAPLPVGIGGWQSDIRVENAPPRPAGQNAPLSDFATVTPDYFKSMGVTLVKGRSFTEADDGRIPVCMVDETFERIHFGGAALGKRMQLGGGTNWMTVVGVVKHVKNYGAGKDSRIETYLPAAQEGMRWSTLAVKTHVPPLSLAEPVRQAIQSVDPDQPVARVMTMEQILARNVADRRLSVVLLSLFAVLALGLAAVGLYGVMAFYVANRTREIGIRMAMGAQLKDVLRLVLSQGGRLVALGLILGIGGAFLIMRLLASLLFQTRATDFGTYLAVPLLLSLVALGACWLPARRAARVNPLEALRRE